MTIEAHAIETGESVFAVDITVNGHQFKGDEPEVMKGKNLGPAPYDLLLASLTECTTMTVRWLAEQKGWPLEKVETHATHEKIDGKDVFGKTVTIHGNDLTDEQRKKLIDAAGKCPIHRTLLSDVSIETAENPSA